MTVREYVTASASSVKRPKTEMMYAPDTYLDKRIISWKQESQKTTFLDPIIKREKAKQLGPGTYAKHRDWVDDMSNGMSHGHRKKGVFAPRDRPLVTTEFMNAAKRRAVPPPGAYNMPPASKPKLGHSDKSSKSSYHIDIAVYQSKQTPTVCYQTTEQLIGPTKPRVLVTKIPDPLVKKEDLGKKPKKSSEPDMGTYDATKAFRYTQKRGFSQKWDTGPVVKFYEGEVRRAKKVPSCSHYVVTNEALNRLSKSPPSIRTRRH